jgi:hypothetical protein
MHVAREIDNDGPAAARFLRDFHRACIGSVFGGVAGLTKAYQYARADAARFKGRYVPHLIWNQDRGVVE